ncbi:hypothetical protein BHM03_00006519 [Ensete ventricosum]|nr:hypothetical protein BHM03_00006519 [Ensete ventricosum]
MSFCLHPDFGPRRTTYLLFRLGFRWVGGWVLRQGSLCLDSSIGRCLCFFQASIFLLDLLLRTKVCFGSSNSILLGWFLCTRSSSTSDFCDQREGFRERHMKTTRSWMDVLPCSTNWFVRQESGDRWTQEENKRFEDALAKFDGDIPDRWEKVAALIPGKTVPDVMSHYRELVDDVTEIEAGRVPCPVYYGTSSFTLDWENSYDPEGWKNTYCGGGGKRSGARASHHERKKGIPWTEEEHRQVSSSFACIFWTLNSQPV